MNHMVEINISDSVVIIDGDCTNQIGTAVAVDDADDGFIHVYLPAWEETLQFHRDAVWLRKSRDQLSQPNV